MSKAIIKSEKLQATEERVIQFLGDMGLPMERSEDGVYFFKYGSTIVTLSLFEDEEETYVRAASTLLKDFDMSVDLMHRLFKLNNQVLFGAFRLFDDRTISFSTTLLGTNLDYNELSRTLKYVAQVSDDFDDVLQGIAGGKKAMDILDGSINP